jgi:hypothetical protein
LRLGLALHTTNNQKIIGKEFLMGLDINWIKTQLQEAKVRKPVGDATMKLIELFDSIELTNENKEKAVEMFSMLALGHAYVKSVKNELWMPVRPGDIKVADEVRVRADAYQGETGTLHNGRRGRVVGVRYGDVIIRSTDGKSPALEGAHYPPQMLEKLVVTVD